MWSSRYYPFRYNSFVDSQSDCMMKLFPWKIVQMRTASSCDDVFYSVQICSVVSMEISSNDIIYAKILEYANNLFFVFGMPFFNVRRYPWRNVHEYESIVIRRNLLPIHGK